MLKHIRLIIILTIIPLLLIACGQSENATQETTEGQNDVNEKVETETVRGDGTQEVQEDDEERYERLAAIFDPLGDVPVPEDNPMTEETIELGKTLYFDTRLSGDNKQSCASCHVPNLGW